MRHQERKYRNRCCEKGRIGFRVTTNETDLYILADSDLREIAHELVQKHRGYIEAYIHQNPTFATAMTPWTLVGPFPRIIDDMVMAGRSAGVGPMAAVAGAIAEHVGADLLSHSKTLFIENGGDIFCKSDRSATIGIFAGSSPLSMRIGLRLPARENSFGVCTSSGTVGHSVSFGRADAVCVISGSCALADAAATAIGNRVTRPSDIEAAISFGRSIPGVEGIVIIKKDKIGAWGDFEIVPLKN